MGKKTPKTTPRTTAINPAAVATSLTAFSPSSVNSTSLYYAHLHCAPDASTLRVFDVDSGRVLSRWASNAGVQGGDEPKVKSIQWCWVPAANAAQDANAGEGKRGKKRRKSDGGGAVDSPAKPTAGSSKPQPSQLTLALGLENGSVLLWHPNGTGSRTLSHPTSISPVTALASPVSSSAPEDGHLWSAHADGSVRVWDTQSGTLVGKVAGLGEELHWDDLLVRYEPTIEEEGKRTVHFVLSHLSLHVYSAQLGGASKKEGKVRDIKATELGRCTGHVEPCYLRWTGFSSSPSASPAFTDMTDDDASSSPASSVDKLTFLSYSSTDRFVQIWSLPLHPAATTPANGTLLARLALDSGVSSASVSSVSSASQTLAAIDSATGNVSLTTLPLSFATAAVQGSTPSKKAKKLGAGVVALEVLCEITAPAQGGRAEAGVAEVAFRSQEEGKALLCRGGVKPVFEVAAIKEEGAWIKKLELSRSASNLLVGNGQESSAGAPAPSRYSEHTSSSVAAASSAPDAAAASDEEEAVNTGELDVDAAEPTLADRLKALSVSQKKERRKAARKARLAEDGLDEDVEVASESSGSEAEDEEFDEEEEPTSAVPATTLTTTLIQALHSSDGPLLESCLAHSNPTLVRSTVKRLPSGGLVLSLLEAIVDRLGREKKGREGMASVKRAKALIGWLKETLIVHVGFLVTIPSLVNRLSALHASLTQRLALQQPLLALKGRLELVMSQIDLRQDRVRAQQSRQITAGAGKRKPAQGRRYVEGESTDEEAVSGEDDEELDSDDEEEEVSDEEEGGDIEDVVLGAGGGSGSEGEFDSDEEGGDSAFDEEEDGAGSGKPRNKVNGVSSLLDLEAEDDESFDEDEDFAQDGFLNDGEDVDEEEAGEDSEFEE
ncbi:hypothetical protein JCM11641_003463 [Rhodosporidiobolus odoratus]